MNTDGSYSHVHTIAGIAVTFGRAAASAAVYVESSAQAELAAVGLACCIADFYSVERVTMVTDDWSLAHWLRTPEKWRGTTLFAKVSSMIATHSGWSVEWEHRSRNSAHGHALRALRSALAAQPKRSGPTAAC